MASVFENISHDRLFPTKVFITQIDYCDFHWHHDYELIFIVKGSVLAYCGSSPTLLSEGDVFLFNSCTIHGVQRSSAENLLVCLQFSPEVISNEHESNKFYHHFYLDSTSEESIPSRPYSYFGQKLAEIVLMSQSEKDSAKIKTHSMVLSLVADLIDYVQYDVRRMPLEINSPTETYVQIAKYVNRNLASDNLAEELCHSLGMSEKSLYRYLKNTIGITLKELVDISRIEQSCIMLKQTQKPLSVIWQSCGFASEVSFYRNFKKQMGVTPNDYRKGSSQICVGLAGESYAGYNLGEASVLLHRYADGTAD